MFTRNGKSAVDPTFLQNQTEALEVFVNWYRGREQHEPYAEVLKRMHRVAALGKDGVRPYVGHYVRNGPDDVIRSSRDALPGQFRSDPNIPNERKLSADLAVNVDALLSELIQWGFSKELYDAVKRRDSSIAWVTPVFGVPKEQWTQNFIHPEGVLHRGAKEQHLQNYLDVAASLIEKIRALKSHEKSHDIFLSYLGAFYHVAINGMPFSGINNSLFMSQVNYFLQVHGFAPVPHGAMDFAAFFLGTNDFIRYFKSEVAKSQLGG